LVFFLFRQTQWPIGLEAIACIFSTFILLLILYLFWKFENKLIDGKQKLNLVYGLIISLLWTIEISINNIIQPGLPERDIIDDIFWGIITLLLFIKIIKDSYQEENIISGIKTGLWTGFTSGLVACLTALFFIVFGIKLLINDSLNIREWSDMKNVSFTKDTTVYFAYQTYAGAMLHLYLLGIFFGCIFGIIGGLLGKGLRLIKKQNIIIQDR